MTASRSGSSRCRLDAATQAVDDPGAVGEQLEKARELVDLTLQKRAAIGGLQTAGARRPRAGRRVGSLADPSRRSRWRSTWPTPGWPSTSSSRCTASPGYLQNVVKHANATSARLTFAVDNGTARLDRRRRGRFRHLRASAGQRRDGRLRPAVDGRTGRTGRRAAEHPIAPRLGHRRDGDDPAVPRRDAIP